jgi:hypothetical protein
MENLFVDCVEDVRRNVIKRRLKAEIIGKKKIGKFDENSDEAKEFEDSLLKLANLAKDRVKLANLRRLSSNSFASSLFSSNFPIFFLPMISALSRLLMTFLLTSSTQSTNRFSISPRSITSFTFLDFSFLSWPFNFSFLSFCSWIEPL